MGKIDSWVLSMLALCCVIGCRPIGKTRNAFQQTRYCYDEGKTGLGEKMNLNGRYVFTETSGSSAYEVNCVFFEDGIFIYHFDPEYFKESSGHKTGFYTRGTQWGRYVLAGDTIKAQFIESPGGMSWSKGEIWFKIMNRENMKWLAFRYGDPIDVSKISQYQNRNMSPGKFVSSDSMPDPDKSWIKSRSWFWCSKEKYQNWKNRSTLH